MEMNLERGDDRMTSKELYCQVCIRHLRRRGGLETITARIGWKSAIFRVVHGGKTPLLNTDTNQGADCWFLNKKATLSTSVEPRGYKNTTATFCLSPGERYTSNHCRKYFYFQILCVCHSFVQEQRVVPAWNCWLPEIGALFFCLGWEEDVIMVQPALCSLTHRDTDGAVTFVISVFQNESSCRNVSSFQLEVKVFCRAWRVPQSCPQPGSRKWSTEIAQLGPSHDESSYTKHIIRH